MRKILVCLKRVVDYNVRIRVRPDGNGVVTDGVKMSVNPFDEIALEEALRIRERGDSDEVVVVSIGSDACQQQLRTGLAMGADRAIQICTDQELEPLDIARILVRLAETESPDLILLGKQAIDGDNNQTGQMLAALWDRPQGTFVSELTISENKATVVREVDSGLETLELDLPAVITSDLRLNEPRYVKMPDIMKAKRKPLDVSNIEDLGVSVESRVRIVTTEAPPPRQKGKIVADVGELVAELRKRDLA